MPTKKKIATGPKAKLMKKNLAQLKAQAKKLKIKGFSTKKKEALVNSIMMAQARNNKGKAKTTRKISSAIKGPNAALIEALETMSPGQRKDLMKMYGLADQDYTATGTRSSIKRMAKKRGAPADRVMVDPVRPGVRRRPTMGEYNGWTNYETWNINIWWDYTFVRMVEDEFGSDVTYDQKNEIAEYLKDLVERDLEEENPYAFDNWWGDATTMYLREVNWRELADSVIDSIQG